MSTLLMDISLYLGDMYPIILQEIKYDVYLLYPSGGRVKGVLKGEVTLMRKDLKIDHKI